MNKDKNRKKSSAIPGFGIIGLLITGLSGIVHAFVFQGGGAGLIASAIAFGLIVYVAFDGSDF